MEVVIRDAREGNATGATILLAIRRCWLTIVIISCSALASRRRSSDIQCPGSTPCVYGLPSPDHCRDYPRVAGALASLFRGPRLLHAFPRFPLISNDR